MLCIFVLFILTFFIYCCFLCNDNIDGLWFATWIFFILGVTQGSLRSVFSHISLQICDKTQTADKLTVVRILHVVVTYKTVSYFFLHLLLLQLRQDCDSALFISESQKSVCQEWASEHICTYTMWLLWRFYEPGLFSLIYFSNARHTSRMQFIDWSLKHALAQIKVSAWRQLSNNQRTYCWPVQLREVLFPGCSRCVFQSIVQVFMQWPFILRTSLYFIHHFSTQLVISFLIFL